jgi:predicted metal-binding membrane protein
MALLFAGGVMNLLWVGVLAAVVLVEKLFPFGVWMARIGGVLLAAYGIALLAMS